jgi:hypothetical protein
VCYTGNHSGGAASSARNDPVSKLSRAVTIITTLKALLLLLAPAACVLPPSAARGQTVSLLKDSVHVKVVANFSALVVVSSDRPFTAGDPFFLLPESPFGFNTNTFDLHARQTNFGLEFTGPKIKGLTTGATFLVLIQNDNLFVDAYGFLPFLAFGDLRNDKWLFAAGLNYDVFNPIDPHVLPIALLYGSGNLGTYRGQVRLERYFDPSPDAHYAIQLAVGEPVASVVTDNRRLLEDSGWPNVELRFSAGSGAVRERLGGRKVRTAQVGVSSVIGQLRTTGIVTTIGQIESPDRAVVEVLGVGLDVQLAFGKRFGILAEGYLGEGLGEYGGGVMQSFNSITFDVIRSRGGFAEAYVYILDNLHLHGGYGIDNPENEDLDILQIKRNQSAYASLFWDLSSIVELSLEADYRKTSFFRPLLSADGFIVMSQLLFRF